ncbi:hypothetical protein I4U23_025641 [Adineta vaga]|nr:hypothetical protein I4U23_025641 [Adineta vaga]
MSTSNKRFFDDDLYRSHFIPSTTSIKKRLCSSLVPTVPQGGTNSINKSSLDHSSSSDTNLISNNLLSYPKEITFE